MQRYVVTERMKRNEPSVNDPVVIDRIRWSGVYDIRDSESGNVICGTTTKRHNAIRIAKRWSSLIIPTVV